ncbi:MFS transporter [Cupriavidus taiwanensis]|uniref:Putative TRANSPORTER, Major Facilitator Superfamily n=1 Tax=Cupriavidus taiwanensis TaxID=164546 RepID=A0A7Z7NJW8_9BURK|nr:MFS transporter [Cupriavidus taiwanensis]SOY89995.1 putative TRANSPORTER, Major Facilitator Superfamily [Cupriavidus taiwanensis]SOZ00491.1 putative TRANSPORTER, Major Facilitator Superfamily [Cupriavidus taiwanensis]SOZ03597.1 putative TRANSPORTER, Major Facilitator Superfamily [Cupriavidus taiwanensis]SPC07836.1 putative TRANSPORTER, Major Facilitator Superfamily [Cupriavidus taiwanensis]SPD42159.1 putative TRANSPORTER, Major Facilitator Superfamily [Cupriavidus taiwanensis]
MTTLEASPGTDAADPRQDASAPRTGPAQPATPPRRLVWILGLTETISWGTLFFAFTVFIDPMIRSLGWSKPFLAGGYSLGLLVWALCSFAVGRLLDRAPARKVMGAGSVLAGLGLLLWAWTPSQSVFLLMWVPLGLAMATTLYEPAFVVLRQAYGDQYQKPIVAVTLMAGFASTIFVPLAQWLVLHVGWRPTLVGFALLNLLVCAPLHARMRYALHPSYTGTGTGAAEGVAGGHDIARATLRQPVFWAVVLAFTATAVVASLLGAHLIPMLTEKGMPVAQQLAVAALIGPAQVAGRMLMMRAGVRHPVRLSLPVYALMSAGLLCFALGHGAWLMVAAVLYGCANGVNTMLRAMAMPELISRHHYATLNGLMMTPVLLMQAAAPWLGALLWRAAGGYWLMLWVMLALALAALLAFGYALHRRGLLRVEAGRP